MAGKRPDGDGLVRKRSDGRWEGRIIIGHKENKLPIFKSVFANTQKELMPKLRQALEDYRDVDKNGRPVRVWTVGSRFAGSSGNADASCCR